MQLNLENRWVEGGVSLPSYLLAVVLSSHFYGVHLFLYGIAILVSLRLLYRLLVVKILHKNLNIPSITTSFMAVAGQIIIYGGLVVLLR